jgi:hypothetical protein
MELTLNIRTIQKYNFRSLPAICDFNKTEFYLLRILDQIFGGFEGLLEISLPDQLLVRAQLAFGLLRLLDLHRISACAVRRANHSIPVMKHVPDIFRLVVPEEVSEVLVGHEDFFSGLDVALCNDRDHLQVVALDLVRIRTAGVAEVVGLEADKRGSHGPGAVFDEPLFEGSGERLQILHFRMSLDFQRRVTSLDHDSRSFRKISERKDSDLIAGQLLDDPVGVFFTAFQLAPDLVTLTFVRPICGLAFPRAVASFLAPGRKVSHIEIVVDKM